MFADNVTPKKKLRKAAKSTRKVVDFSRLVQRVADKYGTEAATAWTKATLAHQQGINEAKLRSAIVSKNLNAIEAAIGISNLQRRLSRAVQPALTNAIGSIGKVSVKTLSAHGVTAQFNASHPNVVHYARTRAAELVAAVPKQTKEVIAEVIARGAERGLTTVEQARAIREVVGLPPHWAGAPGALEADLRAGRVAAATSRRMSAVLKQQIRSASMKGTLTDAFIKRATAEYTSSLINARSLTIARTETQRAANFGLNESWMQAKAQGALPPETRRFWIVTPDDRLCPICLRIPAMNSDGRGLTEPFMTPEGTVDSPPAPHPNCRCAIGLGFGAPGSTAPVPGARGAAIAETQQPVARIVSPGGESRPPVGTVSRGVNMEEEELRTQMKRVDELMGAPNIEDTRFESLAFINKSLDVALTPAKHPNFTTSFVTDKKGNVVGGGAMEFQRGNVAQIHHLGSVTSGAGTQVLEDLIAQARKAGMTTVRAVSTPDAVKFYEKHGFVGTDRKLELDLASVDRVAPEGTAVRGVAAETHAAVEQVLQEMNVNPKVVAYTSKMGKAQRGAQFHGDVVGRYYKGKIYIDPRRPAKLIKQTVAHEAEHLKFDIALRADKTLKRDILRDYRGLERDDGVTKYSTAHWESAQTVEDMFPGEHWYKVLPVNETLAEMRAMQVAGRNVGSARYRKLMKRVEKGYEKGAKKGVKYGKQEGAAQVEEALPSHAEVKALGYSDETVLERSAVADGPPPTLPAAPAPKPGTLETVPKVWARLSDREKELLHGVRVDRQRGKTIIGRRGVPIEGRYIGHERRIELAAQGNWATAAHEVGHAIDHNLIGGSGLSYASDTSEFRQAVQAGMARSEGGFYARVLKAYPSDKLHREVFADIYATVRMKAKVRLGMQSAADMKKEFPEAVAWVKKRLQAGGIEL